PLAEARLRGLEYELLLRRELFHDRVPIEADLRQIATVIKAGLAAFATRYGSQIAAELDLPAGRVAPLLQPVFGGFPAGPGNMDAQIVEALDKAAAHWRRSPPERGKHGPGIPPWQPPQNLAEAQERERRAKAQLETLKLRIRGGELLADQEIRFVGP